MLTLYPGRSLVKNIGHDRSGRHSGSSNRFDVQLADRRVAVENIPIEEHVVARRAVADFLRTLRPGILG